MSYAVVFLLTPKDESGKTLAALLTRFVKNRGDSNF
jgi:hypothetical protein